MPPHTRIRSAHRPDDARDRPRRPAAQAVLGLLALVAVLVGAAAASPSPASAARDVTWSIADDAVLSGTHGDPEPIVAQWHDAGVTNVRMFAEWAHIAPAPDAKRPPAGFGPGAANAYDLTTLDRRIDLVRRHGMTVTLVMTGPGPVWGSLEPSRRNGRWRPSPAMFATFTRTVAAHVADRVDDYILWNEPNVATWLQPQNRCVRGRCTAASPHAYRRLAAAGIAAIRGTDPVARIAIGATSPKGDLRPTRTNGTIPPLTFLRDLGCVDQAYRRIRTGECRAFRPLGGNVLAYHPHPNQNAPGYRSPRSADARIGDLSRLTSVVDRLTRMKRLRVVGARRFPLWLDEYGYETNPPERKRGVSYAKQAAWSQWGWWIAWNHPRVRMLAQYEWMDEGDASDLVDPSGWQSGLFRFDGRPKPLAAAFPNPIFAGRTDRRATVWGQVRTTTAALPVQLERRTSAGWRPYRTITTDARGAFVVRVPRGSKAAYRYTFVSPTDGTTRSSAATTVRDLRRPG